MGKPVCEGSMLLCGRVVLGALLLSLFLTGYPVRAEDDGDRETLLERKKQLLDRAETLRREQDLLLFEKSAWSADSKYLLIRLTERTGQLKYKNRVLRDFSLLYAPGSGRAVRGLATVTRKIEDPKGRRSALIFGNSFALLAQGSDVRLDPRLPRIALRKKDYKAIFYLLEKGAQAYIVW